MEKSHKRRGLPDSVRHVPRPRKVPAWLEAERYFRRYRDSKKDIPLRAPVLTVYDEWGPVNWDKLTETDKASG